jgi:hypothetical protein
MNQAKALEEIGKGLAILTYQVSQENLSGQFSKNRISEDLLMPIFSRIFAAPALHNLNTATQNHPYLDLADDTARIGIQVTTQESAVKITKTLEGVVAAKLNQQYDRIIVFLLCDSRPRFTPKTKNKWAAICAGKMTFLPERDIVALPQLLSSIQLLRYSEIVELRDLVAKSIVGEEYVDVVGRVLRVSKANLEYEKRTNRYIPGVFVERRETKQLCRCFCHPILFFQRSIESVKQLNLISWNRFMDRAGLPALPIPDMSAIPASSNLGDIQVASVKARQSFDPLFAVLKEFKENGRESQLAASVPAAKKPFFEENAHELRNGLQSLPYYLNDVIDELKMPEKRIFMMTGRAGQGKTNLLCDLVETFLFKHEIPCAFLSGRQLGLKQGPDLGQTICDHLFEKKVATLDEAALLLSKEAIRSNKPFIVIIDGLNEHRNIALFAQQLEVVVDSMLQFPGIRFLFSCRSEFFDQRFSNFINGHLSSEMFICQSTEGRLEDEERAELVGVYFEFFGVDGTRVADEVRENLTRDMLLLRFFCETYGTRNKAVGYVQPYVRHFYREELFERYLSEKLHTADLFLKTITTTVSPVSTVQSLHRVLEICVEQMISRWEFGNIPTTAIPLELHPALYSLLDEELIIRRDIWSEEESATSVETVNFTFDEFRDYMLAQYLVHRVFPRGQSEFAAIIAKSDPERSQPTEGLKRFLFYAARKKTNGTFYRFYSAQGWYSDVYDREVFNLDARNLTDADKVAITDILKQGDYKAAQIAQRLALRWSAKYWPVLNLGLLLDYIAGAPPESYRTLILGAIGARSYRDETSIAGSFCTFVTEYIIAQNLETEIDVYRDVVRFLIFLLPVESTFVLSSPAYDALLRVITKAPQEVIDLLLEALRYRFDDHKPFVWRLLHEAMLLKPDPRIKTTAESAASANASGDQRLQVEIARTIGDFPSEGGNRQ